MRINTVVKVKGRKGIITHRMPGTVAEMLYVKAGKDSGWYRKTELVAA